MASKIELQLTHEILELARNYTILEAAKYCPRWIDRDDLVQDVMLNLLRKPLRYDPSKGPPEKTLLRIIVRRIVLKYVAREKRHTSRFVQSQKLEREESNDEALEDEFPVELSRGTAPKKSIDRRVELLRNSSTLDHIWSFIDEKSKGLCRLIIDCGGNVSEAARRLGLTEGAVRYRLRLLAPKVRAASLCAF